MLDLLGPFLVLGAFLAAQHFGLITPAITALRKARSSGGVLWKKAEFHLKTIFVGKVIHLLFLVSGIQALLLGISWIYVVTEEVDVSDAMGTLLWIGGGIAVALIAWQLLTAVRMLPARPAYQEENGQRQRYPLYLQDANNLWLDEEENIIRYKDATLAPIQLDDEGRALRYHQIPGGWYDAKSDTPLVYPDNTARRLNNAGKTLRYYQVNGVWRDANITPHTAGFLPNTPPMATWETTNAPAVNLKETLSDEDRRVAHALADMEVLDDNVENRNRLSSTSIGWSLTLLLVSTLYLGVFLVWCGLRTGHPFIIHPDDGDVTIPFGFRFLIALGMVSWTVAAKILQAIAAMAAWGQNKTIKVTEFALTLLARQGMLATVGITKDNVNQQIKPVDLADEDRNSRAIAALPKLLFFTYILHVGIVFALPIPWLGEIVTAIIFLRAFLDTRASEYGWKYEVENDRSNFARALRKALPIFLAVTMLAMMNDGIAGFVFGQSYLLIQALIAIGTGATQFAVLDWFGNGLILIVGLGIGWLAWNLYRGIQDAKKAPKFLRSWIATTLLLGAPSIAVLFGIVGIVLNVFDVQEVGFPKAPSVTYGVSHKNEGPKLAAVVDDLKEAPTAAEMEESAAKRIALDLARLLDRTGMDPTPRASASTATAEPAPAPPSPPPPATEEDTPVAEEAAKPTPKTTVQASSQAKPRGCTPKRIALYKRFHNGAMPPNCQ